MYIYIQQNESWCCVEMKKNYFYNMLMYLYFIRVTSIYLLLVSRKSILSDSDPEGKKVNILYRREFICTINHFPLSLTPNIASPYRSVPSFMEHGPAAVSTLVRSQLCHGSALLGLLESEYIVSIYNVNIYQNIICQEGFVQTEYMYICICMYINAYSYSLYSHGSSKTFSDLS